MSLINCNQKCKHQKEGYCSLKKANVVTNANGSDNNCLYFEKLESRVKDLARKVPDAPF